MYKIYPFCGKLTAKGDFFICTAVTFESGDFYFGRNLDLSYHYDETVTVTPRRYPFCFRNGEKSDNHFAIIGIATIVDSYPLYYDATNEKGLSMAGLNFPDNAVYCPENKTKNNVAPFELIPYILGKCSTADEAYTEFERINIWNNPFSADYPLTPLHWVVADKKRCFAVEPMADGLKLHENPIGVLTNNPPFDCQMQNLANYVTLNPEHNGTGAFGLPGDMTSSSRFVRTVFAKTYALKGENEYENVNQFFRILGFTEQVKGLNRLPDGKCHYTVYSSCCNTDRGLYYYTTYEQREIVCTDMNKEKLDGENLRNYPLIKNKNFLNQN